MENIVEALSRLGSFNTFVRLIEKANMANAIDTEGPFTVLAPIDEAFADLPEGRLEELSADPEKSRKFVNNHLILGELTTDDFQETPLLETVGGTKIILDILDDTLMINDTAIIRPDISFLGGEIQVIDGVLLPEKQ